MDDWQSQDAWIWTLNRKVAEFLRDPSETRKAELQGLLTAYQTRWRQTALHRCRSTAYLPFF